MGKPGMGGDGCCEVKNVYGSWNPAMDGVYVLVGKRWDIPSVCNSPCVYEKMNGMGGMGKPGMGGMGKPGMGGSGMGGSGMGGSGMGGMEGSGLGGMGGSGMGGMGGSGMGGMGGYGMGSGMNGYGGGRRSQYYFKPSQFTKAECDAFPSGMDSGSISGSGTGSGPMSGYGSS